MDEMDKVTGEILTSEQAMTDVLQEVLYRLRYLSTRIEEIEKGIGGGYVNNVGEAYSNYKTNIYDRR
jgi:hypothetical protein